ncbi:uncharacterized [Tachysurus ichikawai]
MKPTGSGNTESLRVFERACVSVCACANSESVLHPFATADFCAPYFFSRHLIVRSCKKKKSLQADKRAHGLSSRTQDAQTRRSAHRVTLRKSFIFPSHLLGDSGACARSRRQTEGLDVRAKPEQDL